MRLAIMNTAAIINNTLSADQQKGFNPNTLSLVDATAKTFKIVSPVYQQHSLLVDKIDLGALFMNTPLDLSGLTFNDAPAVDFSALMTKLSVDLVDNMPKLNDQPFDPIDPTDELGVHFQQVQRLTGLITLQRHEVSLSRLDNVMTIEATNAMLYTGKVDVILPE